MTEPDITVIDIVRHPDYCTGASGGFTNIDFRIIFFFDKPLNDGKHIERFNKSEIIMSPQVAKRVAQWMLKRVEDYEKTFGTIIEPILIKPVSIGGNDFVKEE